MRAESLNLGNVTNEGFLQGVLVPETLAILRENGLTTTLQARQAAGLRPIGLTCETINVCNAECVFCPYQIQSRPTGTMSNELFRKVIEDYVEIGGGPLSLTPMVGDILLDRELPHRVETLRQFKPSVVPSVTTNLYGLDRLTDQDATDLLNCLARLHVSTYGITAEECEALTRRKHFQKYLKNARRLTTLWEASSKQCEIVIGFRTAYDYGRQQLEDFILSAFGHPFFFNGLTTTRYANWGGSVSGVLPGNAEWLPAQHNHVTCALLIAGMQVYWDGRVSACLCCDYDAGKELYLGDVSKQSLKEIYNSELNRRIWQQHESGNLPRICQSCTFHVAMADLDKEHALIKSWRDFVGG